MNKTATIFDKSGLIALQLGMTVEVQTNPYWYGEIVDIEGREGQEKVEVEGLHEPKREWVSVKDVVAWKGKTEGSKRTAMFNKGDRIKFVGDFPAGSVGEKYRNEGSEGVVQGEGYDPDYFDLEGNGPTGSDGQYSVLMDDGYDLMVPEKNLEKVASMNKTSAIDSNGQELKVGDMVRVLGFAGETVEAEVTSVTERQIQVSWVEDGMKMATNIWTDGRSKIEKVAAWRSGNHLRLASKKTAWNPEGTDATPNAEKIMRAFDDVERETGAQSGTAVREEPWASKFLAHFVADGCKPASDDDLKALEDYNYHSAIYILTMNGLVTGNYYTKSTYGSKKTASELTDAIGEPILVGDKVLDTETDEEGDVIEVSGVEAFIEWLSSGRQEWTTGDMLVKAMKKEAEYFEDEIFDEDTTDDEGAFNPNSSSAVSHSFAVGDILHGSFGYDETHNYFAEVTGLVGSSTLLVRPISYEQVGEMEDRFSSRVRPIPGKYIGPEVRTRVNRSGNYAKVPVPNISEMMSASKCNPSDTFYASSGFH